MAAIETDAREPAVRLDALLVPHPQARRLADGLFVSEMLTATAMGPGLEAETSRARWCWRLFVPLIISSGGNSGSAGRLADHPGAGGRRARHP